MSIFFVNVNFIQTLRIRLSDNKYFQSTMASQNLEQTKQKRKEMKQSFKKFVQKVNEAQKLLNLQQKQQHPAGEQQLCQIIDELYCFIKYYGYVFYFNIFISLNDQTQTPIITKIMSMIFTLIKGQSKTISYKYEEIYAICELINEYSKDLQDLFDQLKGERNLKVKRQTIRANLMDKILSIIKMIEIGKNSQKNTKKITDTARSAKFIELSHFVLSSLRLIASSQLSDASQKQKFLESCGAILKFAPQNFLEERTLNNYKEVIDKSLRKSGKNLAHCCSIFVIKMDEYLKQESNFHEHKNYHWPIEMPSIIKHVKKTIVGFLNLQGGIIYIGMKQNHDDVQSMGIYLTNEQVVKFFEWVHQLCNSIYPLLSKDNDQDYQQVYNQSVKQLKQRFTLQLTSQYVINKYVAVQYLSVIDYKTREDIYQQSQGPLKRLYLIRIKIKAGSKFDTFHLLKEEKQGEIQCFKRNDASVKKLNLEEFFILHNQRMIEYLNEVQDDESVVQHECPKVHFKF